jgi:protein TonB
MAEVHTMDSSSDRATSWPLAAQVGAWVTPVVASGLVHVLLIGAVLAIGIRATPRERLVAQADLIVLEREVLPTAPIPTPRLETPRPASPPPSPVVPPLPPPRVSSTPPPPKAVENPAIKPEAPPKVEEALPPPPKSEDRKAESAPPPSPKEDAPPTTALRADDAKSPAASEARPRHDAVAESSGPQAETRRPGGSLLGAPTPSGEERSGSGRAGPAPSSGGPPSAAGGAGTGVAALPGQATSRSGTGITRSAIPRGGYQIQPAYPATARQLRIQGTSLLRVYVAPDGHVTDVVVTKSAGHADMDQAAVAAVRQWRFEPGRRGEEPIGMWVVLPVEFRIK